MPKRTTTPGCLRVQLREGATHLAYWGGDVEHPERARAASEGALEFELAERAARELAAVAGEVYVLVADKGDVPTTTGKR